jgi:hypothetical protein
MPADDQPRLGPDITPLHRAVNVMHGDVCEIWYALDRSPLAPFRLRAADRHELQQIAEKLAEFAGRMALLFRAEDD